MRVALVQLTSSDDPNGNLPVTLDFISEAARAGAQFVLTPEVTNCVSASRAHQASVLTHERDDPTLAAIRKVAQDHGIWILIGSLALKPNPPEKRFVNRSFLIDPSGSIAARYDKIHMFDVVLSESESYRESAGYRPGDAAVLAEVDDFIVGMTICYDIRFPHLYRDLAREGAHVLTVPSAFSPTTGEAHWETLLRARAIETGCYVLAPAQTGVHDATSGKSRKTYGHSLAVDPWGNVIADGETEPGICYLELDIGRVDQARQRVPSLSHDRVYNRLR